MAYVTGLHLDERGLRGWGDAEDRQGYKPLEPRDFKGSFKGDTEPYEAYIGPHWQYFWL